MDLEPLLRKVENTAPVYDFEPCWAYQSGSYELAGVNSNIHFAQVHFLNHG
jgi:hypothetical protein